MWESVYIQDFYRLSSSRQIGMPVGPIPVSEILKFCEHFNIEDSDDYLYIIQAMDNAYLDMVAEKQAKDSATNTSGNKTVRGVR